MKTKLKEKSLADKNKVPDIENGRHPEALVSEIAFRAYQIWQEHGCTHGFDQQHWLQAEQEMLAKYS